MADNRTSNKRTDVVQCEFCGEYYSVTYKRCPFCDEIRAEQDQANGGSARSAGKSASSAKSGGKRIAPPTGSSSSSGTSSGGGRSGGNRGGGGSSFNVLRVIGVAIPLVLIVAAIYIIITVLGPMITAGKGEDPNSTPPSQSQSASPAPSQSASVPPSQSPATPSDPNAPPIPSGGPVPSDTPGTGGTTGAGGTTGTAGNVTGITLDKSDFTLTANESWKINATLSPSGASGTITWSVDNPDALRVAQDGTVTNINSSSSRVTVNVTATCGNVSATCIVRCAAGSTPASPEPSGSPSPSPSPSTSPSASPSPSTSPGGGTLSPGPARVANTGTGLRVRSGPGTNYEAVASLVDGDDVQIVRAAENGWYEITFKGTSGQDTPGYVLGEYLTQ